MSSRVGHERLRRRRRDEVATIMKTDAARAALALHGTPLLMLDPGRVREQYERLRTALPGVRLHYAVKALAHESVIEVLDRAGCGFDVATGEELALLTERSIDPDRIIHTHPVKKPAEISEAIAAGIRTFVVDNEVEAEKFADAPADVGVLVRLAYRSPHAKSDLSSKFGVEPHDAERLVARAVALGVRVAGFSFHVGSQLDDPSRLARAIIATTGLMDRLERRFGIRFEILDIGGGFPVSYDEAVCGLDELAAHVRPALDIAYGRWQILAEPGRAMVADAMTLVTSVVGISDRADGRWYYLDDGVYGSYSNVMTEDVHPLVFAVRDLHGVPRDEPRSTATLAGPTCDSADVIARGVSFPLLEVGDLCVSPSMGAYTAVTATRFNGRPLTPIEVLAPPAAASPMSAAAEDDVVQTVP